MTVWILTFVHRLQDGSVSEEVRGVYVSQGSAEDAKREWVTQRFYGEEFDSVIELPVVAIREYEVQP